MDSTVRRPCTPIESLSKSLKEIMQIKQGKIKKRSWKEFKKEQDEN